MIDGDPEDDRTQIVSVRLPEATFEREPGDLDDVATHFVNRRTNNPVARLVVIDGPGIGNARPVYPGTNGIGRDRRNRIPLDFGDDSISRSGHAVIVAGSAGQDMRIIDGGKVNPVHVNSVMIAAEQLLKVGDIVEIGATLLRVEPV